MSDDLQRKLNYQFADPSLLTMALTHASHESDITYERLEFLGDRVLGLAVAEILYKTFDQEAEGDMAKRLASLVQGTTLAQIAQEIHLGDHIILSESERNTGGAENDHILADVMEAILGALYLDAGFADCKALIERLWGDRFQTMTKPPQHPKTGLQEWAQSKSLPLPTYEITAQTGPDHAPEFEVAVTVADFGTCTASGKSRQEAEKRAAAAFLKTHEGKA